jgi:hypothetical protein
VPGHSSKERDFTIRARQSVDKAIGEHPDGGPIDDLETKKNPHAVALGRLGGRKGGKARAQKLSAEKRKEIATKAARKRWGKD